MRLTLTKKIGFLLLLPLLGSLIGVGFFTSFLDSTRTDGHFINVSGRQRMLAAEMRAWAHMVAIGQEEDREGLRLRVAEFDATLATLQTGGSVMGGTVAPPPPEVRSELAAVGALWRELKPDLDVVATEPRGEPRFEDANGRVESRIDDLAARSQVVVAAFEDRTQRVRKQVFQTLAGIAVLVFLIFIVGMVLTRRYIVRPVLRLDDVARRIRGGDFSQRLDIATGDELSALAETFNDMTEQVQLLIEAGNLRRKHAETIVESVPAGLVVLRQDLTALRANRWFREAFGIDESAVAGRALTDLLPASGLREAAHEVLATGEARRGLVCQVPGKDGTSRSLRVTIAGTQLAEEGEERLIVVVEDLSEEERLVALARASEHRFQGVVENATDGIVLSGKDGLISSFNRAAEKMFGWRREEVLGKPVTLLMPEKYRAAHEHGVARYVDTRKPSALRTIWVAEGLRKDGSIFPIDITIGAFLVDGEFVLTGFLRDITERRRTEADLRRSEERFRTVVERLPDPFFITREGRVVHVNKAFCSFLGYGASDELVGRMSLDLLHPDERAMMVERRRVLAEDPRQLPLVVTRFLHKDGRALTAEVAATPIEFEDGSSVAFVARDLTERQQMQTKLLAADRMASVGILAAGVAHEINNPLAYVIANLHHLAQELPKVSGRCESCKAKLAMPPGSDSVPATVTSDLGELVEVLSEAREGADRVRQIVRDLKSFSRADEVKHDAVDVRRVLDSSARMAANEIRHRARLVKDYGEVPLVDASEAQLGQVFLNLMVNAAQAMPDGAADRNEIRISTRLDPAGRVVVEVRDTGSGIPAELVERIFEPFFTTKPIGVGTGLGLSICHGIVTGLGGELTVESTVGQGTTFRVALQPTREDTETVVPAATLVARVDRRGRLLVVDDEPLIGASILRALGDEHDVSCETDARRAFARVAAGERFDVILSDVMMPLMNGIELHAALVRDAPEQAERMVFLTGGAFTTAARDFLDRVPNQRLEKPFDTQGLRALIRDRLK